MNTDGDKYTGAYDITRYVVVLSILHDELYTYGVFLFSTFNVLHRTDFVSKVLFFFRFCPFEKHKKMIFVGFIHMYI